MILRPVRPASPIGPPMTKRPVGLTYTRVSRSNNAPGMTGSMIRSRTVARISSSETSGSCWVEMTTASTRTGFAPSYSTVTCDFASGRNHAIEPSLRFVASSRVRLCASTIGSGMSSAVSRHA